MFIPKHNITQLFFSPDDNLGANKSLDSSSAILDILSADDTEDSEDEQIDLSPKPKKTDENTEDKDDKTPEKEVVDKEDEDKDEEDDLSEIEDELDGDKELDDEELEVVSMPRRKEILAKYPELFKDFPGLEKAYFRDQKFSEMFPSPKDAELVVEKAKTLDNFESELLGGNTVNVLKAVKEENSNSFNKLVDNYLPSLRQVDEKAYFHVLGTVIKGTIYNMVKSARESNNEELQDAARTLNKFVFDTETYTPPKKLSESEDNKPNPEAEKLAREREQFTKERFETARNGLETRVHRILTSAIDKNIDPKTSMTDWVREKASKDAHDSLTKLLEKDARFRAILDKGWKKAFEENFSEESMGRIRKIILNRAQSLLPTVIKQARNAALKGTGKRVRDTNNTDDTDVDNSGDTTSSSNRGPLKSKGEGKTPSPRKTSTEVPKGMSNRDFLMQD